MKTLFVVLVIALLSFSGRPSFSYHWFTFFGSTIPEMYDQNNYYMDEDNFPDCPNVNGTIYCSILTTIDPNSPIGNPLPEMTGVIARRYRE